MQLLSNHVLTAAALVCRYNHKSYQPTGTESLLIKVRIVSARHLVKPGKGVASPFVEMEIMGVDGDHAKYKTRVVPDNGFNPVWNESFSFHIGMPELACLVVTVFDNDMFDDANAIGQCVLPLGCHAAPGLRPGFRSLQLLNTYSEPLELSSLLVEIRCKYSADGEDDDYHSLQVCVD